VESSGKQWKAVKGSEKAVESSEKQFFFSPFLLLFFGVCRKRRRQRRVRRRQLQESPQGPPSGQRRPPTTEHWRRCASTRGAWPPRVHPGEAWRWRGQGQGQGDRGGGCAADDPGPRAGQPGPALQPLGRARRARLQLGEWCCCTAVCGVRRVTCDLWLVACYLPMACTHWCCTE